MHAGAGGPTVGGSNIKDPLEVRKRPFQRTFAILLFQNSISASFVLCNQSDRKTVALIHTKYMKAIFEYQENHIVRAKVSEHVISENVSDYPYR